jgi:hypothetical protein
MGWRAPVGCHGAVGVLDWGGASAAVAVDGGQKGRRKSGEEMSLGKGDAVEKQCGNE